MNNNEFIGEFIKIAGSFEMLTEEKTMELSTLVRKMVNEVFDGQTSRKVFKDNALPGESGETFWNWFEWSLDPEKQRIFNEGVRAKRELVNANLRLVIEVGKKYQRLASFNELLQEGCDGLVIGIEKFDPSKGYQLSTYIYWWIRQGMTRYLTKLSRVIRISDEAYTIASKVNRASRAMPEGKKSSLAELSKTTGIPPEKIAEVKSLPTMKDIYSLDAPVEKLFRTRPEEGDLGSLIGEVDDSAEKLLVREGMRGAIDSLVEAAKLTTVQVRMIFLVHGIDDRGPMSIPKAARTLYLQEMYGKNEYNKAIRRLKSARRKVDLKLDHVFELVG